MISGHDKFGKVSNVLMTESTMPSMNLGFVVNRISLCTNVIKVFRKVYGPVYIKAKLGPNMNGNHCISGKVSIVSLTSTKIRDTRINVSQPVQLINELLTVTKILWLKAE